MALTSPDEWATATGRNQPHVKSWASQVPDDVLVFLRATNQSQPTLVEWFQTVVAEAYPNDEWPKQASRHKIARLMQDLRRQ
jgi:hypothetical protein